MCVGSRGIAWPQGCAGDLWFAGRPSRDPNASFCRRKALRIGEAARVDARGARLVLAHRGSLHGEARGATGSVRCPSRTSPRAENAAERGAARWLCPRCPKGRKLAGARPNALATWGRNAARRSGAAMRSELASICDAVGPAKAGCSGIARSKGARVGASVADGGSERLSSSPRSAARSAGTMGIARNNGLSLDEGGGRGGERNGVG